ncbi:BAH/PHD-containing protein [Metarhizium robertsii ARSEF 23]|uniref:BAH/PHD-containing protein n=1 Tax=Metarhizium robertsii (strain ARSEF 23 / ATCC MYA-3075) TaxID=655844 RepID=E9F0A1_METRA|nr:BAH/PHD-containing protein [Metarhizium robertsii ARSEF 23]EFY98561.2 BAH/PHD-containing protein [Metarhizium robertsii ARSEF 23]
MAQQNDSKVTNADAQSASDPVNASSSSDPSSKDSGADMAAGYGTRSRNRGGNARINYAEDKDIDMDVYDYYDKKDQDVPKKSSRKSDVAANGDGAARAVGSRRGAAEEARAVGASNQNGSKSSTPSGVGVGVGGGASQGAPTSGAAQGSRKRKATAVSTRKAGQMGQLEGTPMPETNMLTFENCNHRPDANGCMVADDGTVLEPNVADHVYLVCEPPGEPYYLGRIMEFLHVHAKGESKRVDSVRINWFYRPKDIGRKNTDTRLLFATMHSDISPLTALRGKCQIRHRVDIDNLETYRRTPDCFWYEKLYDRYIQKNYDLIPTSTIVNVPDKVKKVLDERWKFVLVEQGRGKELTSAVKLCKRCSGYCASNDSVDCAVCQNTYHMNCVKPPLLKKPSRGFAWSCAACSRAQERKLEARNTPNGTDANGDIDDDDALDDDDDDMPGIITDRTTPADNEEHHHATAEQIYQASLWPWRYLGMHCKPEDALDYDDRIHPRASTRIGPRHQANVGVWPGRPVEYVKPLETRKGRGAPKLSKEAQIAQEAEKALRTKRPKWVQDEPPGYQVRGEDLDENDPAATSTRLWMPPPSDTVSDDDIVGYMTKAQGMAKRLNIPERSTNLQDVALETLFRHDYDPAAALKTLPDIKRDSFKEPTLTPAENRKFEEGVAKYGSELHLVMKHVKTMTPGAVVRWYYTWKKTERGRQIWGSYSGRKGKKLAKKEETAASKAADDVADADDDSAFDTEKALVQKRSFICLFCESQDCRQWRRAPASQGPLSENGGRATSKDKGNQSVVALCRRCAELWRRYAVRYEPPEDLIKKAGQSGAKIWKKKQEEELLKEIQIAEDMGLMSPYRSSTPAASVNGLEPPRKKLKGAPERDTDAVVSDAGSNTTISRKKDKTAETTPVPDLPKPRTLPCAICDQMEPLGDQHLSCRECRLTVHRHCYGVMDSRIQGKWICDMCSNDKSPQVSIQYKCVLCPVEYTEQDFIEQPKLTHHKKKMSDKDRERERLEVQQARKAAEFYRKRQEDLNRPVNPREPLKRTADNNWVHVTCAVWTPEVKFGNAKALEPSEGIPSIPRARYDEVCQVCNQQGGACVSCHQCRIPYHVECARQAGHLLAFDITPVKSSRRDQFNIVTVKGEIGTMSAVLWCQDHIPTKTIAHKMYDVVNESGLSALQLYVQNYKQADLALTGTVRKANLMMAAAKMSGLPVVPSARRTSASATTAAAAPNGASSHSRNREPIDAATNAQQPGEKVCITCGIDVTPRWWPIEKTQERQLTNGHHGAIGFEAQKFVEQRKFQCHKCKKNPRTPKSFAAARPSPPLVAEPPRQHLGGSQSQTPAPPSLRSPSRVLSADYRAAPLRPEIHSLLHHPSSHGPSAPGPSAAHGPPPAGHPATHSQAHSLGSRPGPVSHGYPQVPLPRTTYNDWGSQHGSPTRHINGGPPPPPLHNTGPPPASGLTALRPPSMSGPPPVAAVSVPHQRPHGSPIYGSALPPSPRRLNGTTASSAYVPSYVSAPAPAHASGPRHSASPGLSNGVLPPRSEGFSHGLHPQRPSYTGGTHGSPPLARSGLPPPGGPPPAGHESAHSAGGLGHRPPENRPASGASASPSLRNLLS